MRILIWCPHVNLGGGKRLLVRLTSAIATHPAVEHVRLAIPRAALEGFPSNNPKIEIVGLSPAQSGGWMAKESWRVDSNPLRILRSRGRYLRYQATAPGLFHSLEHDVDLVYVFWPHGVPFYPFSKPVVCTFQDATLLDFPEILGGRGTTLEHEKSSQWLYAACMVIVSSENTTRRLAVHFNQPLKSVRRIYHNILLDETLASEQQSTGSTPVAGLPERYFMYPANINSHKNHEHLLIAWARFARRQDYPLVLVGEGVDVLKANRPLTANHYWRQDALQGLMKRLGLVHGRDVYTLGYVSDSDLNQIQRQAMAMIMPSLSEGGGSYPVEEALALGLPVLCSDIPVMRETLAGRDGGVAWFDGYAPDDIVNKTNHLIDHYGDYKKAAEAARRIPRPTWADIGTQYVEAFQAALAKAD